LNADFGSSFCNWNVTKACFYTSLQVVRSGGKNANTDCLS
jgi:hypothetical protein